MHLVRKAFSKLFIFFITHGIQKKDATMRITSSSSGTDAEILNLRKLTELKRKNVHPTNFRRNWLRVGLQESSKLLKMQLHYYVHLRTYIHEKGMNPLIPPQILVK